MCALLDKRRVPGCRLAQWNREHGLETVDHIAANQQRNSEAAFLDRNALQLVNNVHVHNIENGPYEAFAQLLAEVFRRIPVARIYLTHLPDFLGQGHLSEETSGSMRSVRFLIKCANYGS